MTGAKMCSLRDISASDSEEYVLMEEKFGK
jgi:hypothetical protein